MGICSSINNGRDVSISRANTTCQSSFRMRLARFLRRPRRRWETNFISYIVEETRNNRLLLRVPDAKQQSTVNNFSRNSLVFMINY